MHTYCCKDQRTPYVPLYHFCVLSGICFLLVGGLFVSLLAVMASFEEWLQKKHNHLIEGISAEVWLADRGYDTNQIVAYAHDAGMEVVIPSKKNRKEQRDDDRYLYRWRHLVENAFLHLKRWRGIATRYAKNTASFLAAVQIRCIAIGFVVLA